MTQHPDPIDGAAILRQSRLLGDMFATDVQTYQPAIDAIDGALRGVRSGAHPGPHAIHGNVYTLRIGVHGATITNARDHHVAAETLTLEAFAAAFGSWTKRAG